MGTVREKFPFASAVVLIGGKISRVRTTAPGSGTPFRQSSTVPLRLTEPGTVAGPEELPLQASAASTDPPVTANSRYRRARFIADLPGQSPASLVPSEVAGNPSGYGPPSGGFPDQVSRIGDPSRL